jgi:predicted transcriptional regulator of viral defense system
LPTKTRTDLAKLSRASKGGLITVSAAAKVLGETERRISNRLARLARQGWLERARRGLYLVRPLEAEPDQVATVEDPWVLAREVFAPCYIGGWSAAEHWGWTEQVFRSMLVMTAAPVRATTHRILGNEFRVFRIPRARLAAGVVSIWRGAERVSVSGPERTLLDCLRNPELCGGIRHLSQLLQAYSENSKHDFARMVTIANRVASGAAWKRLGYLATLLWPQEAAVIEACRRRLSAGNARLDPAVARRGKLLKRWRLWVNVDLSELAPAPVTRP